MNRGVLQSSPVQQMMAGSSPTWWSINNMRPPHHQSTSSFLPTTATTTPSNINHFPHYTPPHVSSLPISSSCYDNQELPAESWSQLLLGGIVVDQEDKCGLSHFQAKKPENWEDQLLNEQTPNVSVVDVKQENSTNGYVYGHGSVEFQSSKSSWSHMMPASSPNSCITSLSSNMLDFSTKKADGRHPPPDRSSECNNTSAGGSLKKARVQPSSTQTSFKVRKEKLGDRITALHQLVSPFGKTDTASVLLEAIGYIRFLQSQVEALSLPYLGSASGNTRQQQPAQGERNCLFPEDPGQLFNDNGTKNKGAPELDSHEEPKKDLKSRGLCLVPISCTLQVGSDNGADYWAPALCGGYR